MREPGGGTLLSPAIEKAKLSVKVSTAEISESRRRLSNNGSTGYGSYGGGKSILGAGSMFPGEAPLSAASGRLKGGNSSSIFSHTQFAHDKAGLDLSAAERLTELRARLEPFMKPRPAAQPSSAATQPAEDGGALPHWGLRKRLRRSRFEVSKDSVVHEWGGRGGGETEGASAEDCGVKGRGHSWAARPASLEAARDAHSAKAAAPTPPRNGTSSRASANPTSTSTRQGSSAERERPGLLQVHKGEVSSNTPRQRSEGSASAERPINDNSNGQPVARSRAITAAATVTALEMGTALCTVKPRSDLQSLEWPRILVGLSRKEKEDDFIRIKGTKLPQRPKKRPKGVERALHYCMPGSSLCDLSRSRYDVREKKSTKKRPRGLKAMESMDSETD